MSIGFFFAVGIFIDDNDCNAGWLGFHTVDCSPNDLCNRFAEHKPGIPVLTTNRDQREWR